MRNNGQMASIMAVTRSIAQDDMPTPQRAVRTGSISYEVRILLIIMLQEVRLGER